MGWSDPAPRGAPASDAANRTVSITGHPPLSYDVLSIDIGSTPSPG